MAYSSIGHMGYALVGLAAGTAEGVQGVIIYLAIYLAMTLGTFACILAMRRNGRMVEDIDQLAGLSPHQPDDGLPACHAALLACRHSALAGFFAKFYVFLAAIHAGLYALAVIGVLLERGRRLLLSPHRQDHVFRRSRRTVRADAGARLPPCSEYHGLFILFYFVYPAPLVTVAGPPPSPCSDALSSSLIAEASRRLPAASPGDDRLDQCRGGAARRGGRAWPALDLVGAAVARTRPRRPRMAVAARQSVREPPHRPQLSRSRRRAARASSPASSPMTPIAKLICLRGPLGASAEMAERRPAHRTSKVAGMLLENTSETAPNRCKSW